MDIRIEKALAFKSAWLLAAALFLLPGCSTASDAEVPGPEPPAPGPEPTGTLLPENVALVARVTGRSESGETIPNPNRTDARFNIGRTDYGNMWDAGNGTVMCVFGDNFDHGGGNWKSNAIALSSDRDLTDGLYYSGMLMDGDAVKEIVVSRAKTGQYPDGSEYEVTCIPTGGVAAGGRQYLNYMSVHDWTPTGDNDQWSVNYSEIVYSDDDGSTWTRSGVRWGADSNFAQVAYLRENGLIYMYGTRSGRYGDVFLARVGETDALDKPAYEYWTGGGWERDEEAAVPVARGTASEMTVAYNSLYDRYMMMYLSVNQRAIVYRDAPLPEGDWSGEKIIMYEDGNALYAPYIHPWFNDGDCLWFVISHAVPTWNVFLMRADLNWDQAGINLLAEGGFEEHPTQALGYKTMWNVHASALTSRDAHSGKIACRFSNEETGRWQDVCTQTVSLRRNAGYAVECWVKSDEALPEGAYVGVRLPDGTIHDATGTAEAGEWTRFGCEFNSGQAAEAEAEAFFGVWGAPGMTLVVDDICLKPMKNNH